MPLARASRRERNLIGFPSIWISPASGGGRPARLRATSKLPWPARPTSATISPRRTERVTSSKAPARRIGRSQAFRLTCDSWRDSAGKLWQPNKLAIINAPAHKLVNQKWIIGTVTFRKDQSGTHADLTLMPPDAFMVQPGVLNIADAQITAQPSASQDPKPPSPQDPPPDVVN